MVIRAALSPLCNSPCKHFIAKYFQHYLHTDQETEALQDGERRGAAPAATLKAASRKESKIISEGDVRIERDREGSLTPGLTPELSR